jgi:NTP pyrophosphatase (non-canonical NTP hydrolase)
MSEPQIINPTTETSSTASHRDEPLRMFHSPYGHSDEENFVFFFNKLQAKAHANAVDKGFWETERSDGESIALMHSELSEALEALRQGNPPDDKVPQHSGAAAELGDTIIRIMDLAGKRGWNVAQAMIDKMEFNAKRAYKHGKKF